jgi:hypothetical protein
MTMWQRMLERFVPLMEADPSWLDRCDGVGGSSGLALAGAVREARLSVPTRKDHAAYDGAVSPLPS